MTIQQANDWLAACISHQLQAEKEVAVAEAALGIAKATANIAYTKRHAATDKVRDAEYAVLQAHRELEKKRLASEPLTPYSL